MSKLNIKPVNNGKTPADRNRFCGPAVISALTGMTTSEAARLVRHVSGRKTVKGTYTWEVKHALAACGIECQRYSRFCGEPIRKANPTLAQWLKATVKQRTAGRVYLLVAGNHYQLIQGRRYVCGITKDIVSIKDKKVKRRARVTEVYEVVADAKVVIPQEARKPKATRNDNHRARAQRLAKQLGIKIDIERFYEFDGSRALQYWIQYDGDYDYVDAGVIEGHCSYDWQEVLWKLSEIKEHVAQ